MSDPPAPADATDRRLMGLALALGRRNLGRTWPNPSVGAVVVDPAGGRSRIVAQAVTAPGGRPHAEPFALAAAGDAARGATLYVSLEPCSHHGRTPPCADAILAAGIARVVSALEDPNALVAGRGHARLREGGVSVVTGIGAHEAARDHRGHVTRVREGRPALTLKLARTADGFAAAADGSRLMISGEAAGARVHMLRARADAIVVGVATLAADDPGLDVRLPGLAERSPGRVVIDSRLRTPLTSRLVATARSRATWIVCTHAASAEPESRLAATGCEILRAPADEAGRVDLRAALRALAARGLTRLFCEGGPTLADALAAADLVDELVLVTGRDALGRPGLPGLPAVGDRLAAGLAGRLRVAWEERAGPDAIAVYERV